MDLKKEAFAFGKGSEVLYLLFNRESAQDIINKLSAAIRPKDQKGYGYAEVYMGIAGKVSDITAYAQEVHPLQNSNSDAEGENFNDIERQGTTGG